MNYKNLTANLLRLPLPFYYWQFHLPYGSADGLLCIQFACLVLQPRLKLVKIVRSLDYVLARRMTKISAAKIICIHNRLIKSQSPHKATHFRGQLFQLPDIFRFFALEDRLRLSVSFSYNWNAAFFTNVSLAKKCFCYVNQGRPRFLYIITLHFSEIANYFVIIIERFILEPTNERAWLWNWQEMNTTIVMETFEWRPPKLSFSNGKKSLRGACDW